MELKGYKYNVMYKQVCITYTSISSQETTHQKINNYCVVNILGDKPAHTAAPSDPVIKIE